MPAKKSKKITFALSAIIQEINVSLSLNRSKFRVTLLASTAMPAWSQQIECANFIMGYVEISAAIILVAVAI